MLEFIKRKTGMNLLYWKIEASLNNIKEKHGQRTDLIESMEKSLTEVGEAVLYFEHCDKMLRSYSSKSYQMEIEIMQLKQQVRNLERRINELEKHEL